MYDRRNRSPSSRWRENRASAEPGRFTVFTVYIPTRAIRRRRHGQPASDLRFRPRFCL